MPKKACCCKPNPSSFCCNPTFYKDFITLFGDSMAEHAEVSPNDWIALYVPRPGQARSKTRRWFLTTDGGCQCCCNCPQGSDDPNAEATGDSDTTFGLGNNTFRSSNVKTKQTFSLKNNLVNTIKNNLFGSRSDGAREKKLTKNLSTTDAISNGSAQSDLNLPTDQFSNRTQEQAPCGSDGAAWTSGNHDLSSEPHRRCSKACCTGDYYTSWLEGSDPIIFAYKYSGCNLIWYPREYSFDKDVYINQCNGFLGTTRVFNNNGQQTNIFKNVQNSCQNWASQKDYAGAAFDTFVSECYQGFYPERQTNSAFPCACTPFPHIHGGIKDSIFNRVNVRITSNQLGYVSYMPPFSAPMLSGEEAGCCWCASCGNNVQAWDLFLKGRISQFRSSYPFFDQQGKVPTQSTTVGVGINCHYHPGQPSIRDTIGTNPNYKRTCYEWGISPYLLRVAKTDHKMAYSIWRHGRTSAYRHDFGPVYKGIDVVINKLEKDVKVKFIKISGIKTSLKEQYIGFIQLEHHFECYSYRSDDGSQSVDMSAMMNHCSYQMAPFERGYSGKYVASTGSIATWRPYKYSSILWQTKRGVPRRVMYQGSGIPLFHFDLVNMENLCLENEIIGPEGSFDGIRFLEHYYRYYFAMRYFSSGTCEEDYTPPGPMEWNFRHLLDSYNYVNEWLQLMIVHGVLRIKDHAIDISADVNKIIQSGRYITNNEGQEELVVADKVALITGGLSGYIDLINFFDVRAGTQNATTPKIIKQKLLNTEGLSTYTGPSSDQESMRCFLPRKATLPIGAIKGGLTAWGCSQSVASFTSFNEEIICPEYKNDAIDIPAELTTTDPQSPYSILSPVKVVSGLGGTFVIDNSGKISPFGGIPAGGDGGCTDNGIAVQYPSSISCIPWYLSILGLFDFSAGPDNPVPQSPEKIPDGSVIDIAFKGADCALALCNFDYGAISALVSDTNTPEANQAYEDDTDDYSEDYIFKNCNGENSRRSFSFPFAVPYQPFEMVPGPGGSVSYGIRAEQEQKPNNTYRLKSWGSRAKFATFSLAQEDANLGRINAGYDQTINPNNLRYPGTNTWFIWTKVAAGLKHYVALDDGGGVFATPLSDNEYGQCEKGYPISYEESAGYGYKGFGRSGAFGNENIGFFYFNHIPRPGYIKEEEWTKEFYVSLTGPDYDKTSYRQYLCACEYGVPLNVCHPPGSGGFGGSDPDPDSCRNPIIKIGDTCETPDPRIYDKTCLLLGTLVATSTIPAGDFADSQPRYTDVAAGHFNTLLLTNENKLEIYGKYWQINENGIINGPLVPVTDSNGETTDVLQGITAFIPPEVEALKGTWNVTYACTLNCGGVTHSPIIDATFNPPSSGNVITAIDSSSDYSICVANSNRVYVWGDASMVPTKYNPQTYIPGTTASVQFNLGNFDPNLVTIDKIAAGVNAFYVYYRLKIPGTDLSSSRLYSYTRYGINNFGTEVPISVQNKQIIDISAGYAHAIAIVSAGANAKTWDYGSFAPETQKYQYKNWNSIPAYFKRDAFFHAIPGGWDFSKWLYGDLCCGSIQEPDHPSLQQDTCSALAYNIYQNDPNTGKPEYNKNLAYSGNPHYFWMRSDWRRLTKQGFNSNFGAKDAIQAGINCDLVDQGMQLDNIGADNSPSSLFSQCGIQNVFVWGESRPMANSQIKFEQQRIEPPCFVPGRCFSNDTEPIYTKGIIPIDVPALSYSLDPNPTVSFRTSKDIFQKRVDRYGLADWGSTSEQVPCIKHKSTNLSYFKYCERHYYLGYDRDLDTWDIYTNPDFLHEYTTNGLSGPQVITQPEMGWGGGTGPNGGTAAGLCGYYSLYNYPMTGPNYPAEKYQYVPINYPIDQNVLKGIYGAKCSQEDPDNSCYACGNREALATVGGAMSYFAGAASFAWLPTCLGSAQNTGESINTMWAPYAYTPVYRTYLSAKQLLKGTDNHIGLTLPPEIDPSYTRYSFIDVLKNPNLTETEKPWLFPSSTKWIPLCWEPQNELNLCGITTTDSAICFASIAGVPLSSNQVVYECLHTELFPRGTTAGKVNTNDAVFYTTLVDCNIGRCCLPPDA